MIDFCEALPGAVWLSNLQPIVEVSNDIQNVRYYHSTEFGRVLIINNELQHVEAWSPFYHEIITHLPCQFLPHVNRGMIMGGGSLFAAEELLKYSSITKIDLVDHDMNVISATLEAYPERRHIIDDKRLNIINESCEHYLSSFKGEYDIIINDCFNLYEIDHLSDIDYYNLIENILSERGIFSDLIYRNLYDSMTKSSLDRIPKKLNKAASLLAVPEYPGIFHLFTMWGKNENLHQGQRKIINGEQLEMINNGAFKIYSPYFLDFYMYLPPYLQKYII